MNKTKRRIFNTAIKVFSEKGYDNASIEEITAIAGVAKGSLYYHFTKKEDIFDLLLEEGRNLLHNNVEIKTKACPTAIDKIKAIILIQVRVTVKYEDFLNVVFSHIWGKEERNMKCKAAVFEYIEFLKNIIQDGIDNGEFYDGDAEVIALEIFGITCSSLIYKMKKDKNVDVRKVYDEFVENVIRMLSKK